MPLENQRSQSTVLLLVRHLHIGQQFHRACSPAQRDRVGSAAEFTLEQQQLHRTATQLWHWPGLLLCAEAKGGVSCNQKIEASSRALIAWQPHKHRKCGSIHFASCAEYHVHMPRLLHPGLSFGKSAAMILSLCLPPSLHRQATPVSDSSGEPLR